MKPFPRLGFFLHRVTSFVDQIEQHDKSSAMLLSSVDLRAAKWTRTDCFKKRLYVMFNKSTLCTLFTIICLNMLFIYFLPVQTLLFDIQQCLKYCEIQCCISFAFSKRFKFTQPHKHCWFTNRKELRSTTVTELTGVRFFTDWIPFVPVAPRWFPLDPVQEETETVRSH